MQKLRHLTLISENGIMLFHTAFLAKEIDEVLLSGFTGAITAIANQLGDTIHTIHMKKQVFYLHHFESYIMILSTSPELGENYVKDRMEILQNSPYLRTMAKEESLELLIDANNELHLQIADLFEIDSGDDKLEDELAELNEEDIFAEVLDSLDNLSEIEL